VRARRRIHGVRRGVLVAPDLAAGAEVERARDFAIVLPGEHDHAIPGDHG
jgi:hypothetical protein